MREEEALKNVRFCKCEIKNDYFVAWLKHETIPIVCKALEKQIPKKWEYEMVNDDDTYVCPCCKEYWYMDYGTPATNEYNYCPNCGQALKWE